MTIEESISILSNAAWLGTDEDRERTEEAVKVAITALQKDGDTISRQTAIDALGSRLDRTAKGEIGSFYNTIIQRDIESIERLPSAQPEIIRCKDCAYWNSESRECSSPNYPDGYVTPAGFYCGWAERRNDE